MDIGQRYNARANKKEIFHNVSIIFRGTHTHIIYKHLYNIEAGNADTERGDRDGVKTPSKIFDYLPRRTVIIMSVKINRSRRFKRQNAIDGGTRTTRRRRYAEPSVSHVE